MEPVGQFHHDHPDILGHGNDHTAKVLRLGVFSGLKFQLADLCQTFNKKRDLFTEMPDQVIAGDIRVLNCIVEEPDHDGGDIHLHLAEDARHLQGMD